MDPSVEFIDDITPLPDNAMYRVRSLPGVAWSQRLYKGQARAQFQDNTFGFFSTL